MEVEEREAQWTFFIWSEYIPMHTKLFTIVKKEYALKFLNLLIRKFNFKTGNFTPNFRKV